MPAQLSQRIDPAFVLCPGLVNCSLHREQRPSFFILSPVERALVPIFFSTRLVTHSIVIIFGNKTQGAAASIHRP